MMNVSMAVEADKTVGSFVLLAIVVFVGSSCG